MHLIGTRAGSLCVTAEILSYLLHHLEAIVLLIRMTTALALLGLIFGTGARSDAKGTATITKSSGVVNTYEHARIHVLGDSSLRITSADGRGSLTIHYAACSFAGELQHCFPYDVTMNQAGSQHPIHLKRGTLYLNNTDASLPLPHSSTQVPSHGIILALRTKRGTFISVTGRVDGEAK
jgi:hypothetical protein